MDQLYFEEGYLEASYFTVIREAEAALPMAVTVSALVDIADATGYYIPDYIAIDYFESGGQVREADAAFTVTATQAVTVERITQAVATVSVSVTNTCAETRIRNSEAAFTAAFAPTLTADAFKNHTAVLDSVSTMSVDAVANRSANVLLEHIADLNAMAAKTVDVVSTASTTATQSTTANTNFSAQATVTSTVTLTCSALNLQFASAQFTVSAKILAVTSRNQYGRPITIDGSPNFVDTFVKYGTHAATNNSFVPIKTTANANIRVTNEFVYEGWHRRASLTQNITLMAIGATAVALTNPPLVGDNQWILLIRRRDLNNASYFSMRLLVKNSANQTEIFDSQESNDSNVYAAWMPTADYSHWAVTRNSAGLMQVFKNGSQIISGTVATMGTASEYRAWWGNLDANTSSSRWDELSLRKKTSSITQAQQTDQPETQVFLFHLDNNLNDDTSNTINVTHSMAAALASTVTVSAQANANTKLASADLSASSTVSAIGIKTQSASADLATASTLSVIIGSVKDSITLNAGAFTVTAQESRLRDAASSITSAFTPTLNAQATRGGEIALASVFAMSTTAASFTDSTANIATAFSVTVAVDGITRSGAAALSSQFNQTTTIGKLQRVSVPISSAFTTVMNVSYFEGTSLIAPMAAVMSVTANKTARITKTLSVVASVSAVGNENPQAPAANPIFSTRQERIDVNVSYNYTYNRVSGTNRRTFNFRTDTSGVTAGSLFPNGSLSINSAEASVNFLVYEYGQSGQQDWYDSVTYSFNIGVVDSVNTGAATSVNGTGSIRIVLDVATANYLTVYLDGSPTPLTLPAPSVSTKSEASRDYYPGFQPFGIPNTNGMFGWPQALFPSANSVVDLNTFGDITSSSATDEAYIPYYGPQEYGQADLIDINFATLTAQPFTVQFGQANAQVLTAISADVRRIRQGVLNLASTVTTAINAGKNVEIGSDLTAQSTISVDAVKVTRTGADVSVVAAQSTANDRRRNTEVTAATTVSASITAVKTTGVVVNAELAVTQTATAFRIQQGESAITALYSQLTVAFQNATGTVLLETVSQMQITAEKNAVGVIALATQFTQVTDTADAKTVRVSSAIAAEFTQVTEGLRIQPAGADVSAQFTQTANTDLSKTTRVSADVNTTVSMTTVGQRLRDGIALQASLGTLSCDIDRLRQFDSNLSAVIYDFTASPTFIIRVTAEFTAFNTQLTVGEIINIDPFLQLKIEPETRINKIPQESRVFIIESETRVNIIKD